MSLYEIVRFLQDNNSGMSGVVLMASGVGIGQSRGLKHLGGGGGGGGGRGGGVKRWG